MTSDHSVYSIVTTTKMKMIIEYIKNYYINKYRISKHNIYISLLCYLEISKTTSNNARKHSWHKYVYSIYSHIYVC